MTVTTSTCAPWCLPEDLDSECTANVDDDVVDAKIQIASDILFDLSGRAFPGICTDLVRPCSTSCCSTPTRTRGCGCWGLSEILLPNLPVRSITRVMVDGVLVAPARYVVADDAYLRFVPEDPFLTVPRRWPCWQDLRKPTTEVDTWSVEYTYGTSPPPGGVNAAAVFACELLKPADKCRLPKRVTSLTRQGVSIAFADRTQDLFAEGLVGLAEVDLWLSSIRYGRRSRQAAVIVPGAGRRNFRTG